MPLEVTKTPHTALSLKWPVAPIRWVANATAIQDHHSAWELKNSSMGLLRILFRLFAAPTTPAKRHEYSPPPAHGSDPSASARLVTLTRETISLAISTPGASLSGKCWVVDGDTIDIGGSRIRLAGIDAPEMEHPYGKAAKSALIRLCQGQTIRAEFHGSDHFDRNMATCFLSDGRDLSAEMVKLGLAIDWPKYSGGKYRVLEPEGVRRKLWRCDARQKGRMPPLRPDQD